MGGGARRRRRDPRRRRPNCFSAEDPRWSLLWTVAAPTAELALAPLRARLTPPGGWEVELSAEPAEQHADRLRRNGRRDGWGRAANRARRRALP